MNANRSLFSTLPLFRGISEDEIPALLRCLHAQEMHYPEAQFIIDPIERLPYIVTILEGSMTLVQEDVNGNRIVMGDLRAGDFLGEGTHGTIHSSLPIRLIIEAGTRLLLMDPEATLKNCEKRCQPHFKLLCNMVELSLDKERRLVYRIEHLSQHSVREKIETFLSIQAARGGSKTFTVPYSRQQLADILVVDRSTLCTELARMQNDGLIKYSGRAFELLDKSEL